ncbi:hypothetical protein DL769_000280 [Monosporascus sp. CRB-8-3]|nr:hypothetical protein DL769_000280 [Monosporascus sp. CRB-8-3]
MASKIDTEYIRLGPLDHIAPCNIPQSIIYLGLKRDVGFEEAFTCLREGLRRTILQAPWLNGRVYLQSRDSPGWRPGQLEIRYESIKQGGGFSQTLEIPLRLNELPKSTSFAELREAGFPLDIFDDEALLWTSPFKPDFKSGAEVFAAQANFVPGGCLLALSIAPPASDGTAMLSVTRLWADHCSSLLRDREDKTAAGNEALLPLPAGGVDRNALDTVMAEAINSFELLECFETNQALDSQHLVGIDGWHGASEDETHLGNSAEASVTLGTSHDDYQESDMKPSVFYMPQPMYTELRQELASVHNGTDVSGNDVICAFIWKSILRAWTAVRAQEEADLGETATLAIPFDARPNLSHLLPAKYLGNLNFEHILTLPLRTLTSPETSVPWVAKMIRTNATRQAHENALLEAYGRLRSIPEYDHRHVQIRASRLSANSPSVGILSPIVLPFNGTCFGEHVFTNGGKPEAFRPMMVEQAPLYSKDHGDREPNTTSSVSDTKTREGVGLVSRRSCHRKFWPTEKVGTMPSDASPLASCADEKVTLGLGHCRLSIVDLSPQGNQPLHDDEGGIHAVVMGEIYDDEQLRERCIQEFGYNFRGHSDSEIVVALYKNYGAPDFLDYLRGEYAFVIYDERSGEVIAARDRFGIKPMFWTVVDNQLLLAPEIKAFLPLGWKPEWDVDSLVLNSCFVGSDTWFKGINRLQPGHYLRALPSGIIEQHQYWDLNFRDKRLVETRTVDEMINEVREKVIEAVRLRLRADVPVGIYLSGGLDSSALAGIAKYLVEEKGIKIGSQDLKQKLACFCIQFDKDSGSDESDIAERTAKFLGMEMHIKNMNEDELARHFEDCVWHNEQFMSDLNTVGKHALSELPRNQGFKVILSGEGADEVFAGYPWFIPEFLGEPDQSSPELPLQQDEPLRQRLREKAIGDIIATFHKAGAIPNRLEVDPELKEQLNGISGPLVFATGVTQRDFYLPVWQNKYSASDTLRKTIDAWSAPARENIKHNWHILHSAMYAWAKCQLPNFILTALGDRSEMAHSIEARPPFLDNHLAELMGGIPPSLKMYYGPDAKGLDSGNSTWWSKDQDQAGAKIWEKWVLREAVKPFITEELYLRRKHPFSAPVKWPKGGPLHQLFTRLLTRENIEALGFIQWSAVQKSLKIAFGENSDPGAWRSCLVVGGLVVLSQRFGVAPASTKQEPVL